MDLAKGQIEGNKPDILSALERQAKAVESLQDTVSQLSSKLESAMRETSPETPEKEVVFQYDTLIGRTVQEHTCKVARCEQMLHSFLQRLGL